MRASHLTLTEARALLDLVRRHRHELEEAESLIRKLGVAIDAGRTPGHNNSGIAILRIDEAG
jgi:hypothetical protein